MERRAGGAGVAALSSPVTRRPRVTSHCMDTRLAPWDYAAPSPPCAPCVWPSDCKNPHGVVLQVSQITPALVCHNAASSFMDYRPSLPPLMEYPRGKKFVNNRLTTLVTQVQAYIWYRHSAKTVRLENASKRGQRAGPFIGTPFVCTPNTANGGCKTCNVCLRTLQFCIAAP